MANNEISLEEHIYNAFRIDVMEHKIVMLEKKIIEMKKTVDSLPTKETFEKESVKLFEGYLKTRQESFTEQLSKLQTIE